MNLRPRLVLTLVLVAVPVGVAASIFELRRERDRATDVVVAQATSRAEAMGREACEDAPYDFPNAPSADADWLFDEPSEPLAQGPVRYHVFDDHRRPARADAPGVPERAWRSLAQRGRARWIVPGQPMRERTLFRLPYGSSRCAALLVELPRPPLASLRSRLVPPLLVVLAVIVAVLASAGPLVRRLVLLRDAVRTGSVRDAASEESDEIGELGSAFAVREATIASQLSALESRERALRDHLAATSHDLLLPMTVLKGHLAALGEDPTDAESLRRALEEGHYLEALIRDLNAEARLRTGAIVRASVDLVDLVDRVRARHAPIAARAGISLEVAVPEGPRVVEADPTLVEQMLSNLVHNAIRHGAPGGHVAVTLADTEGGFLVEVLDDNASVDAASVTRLGERGFRTDEARGRTPDGLGLGAHIAREVARVHGYTLEFRMNEPVGLRVSIRGSRGSVGS